MVWQAASVCVLLGSLVFSGSCYAFGMCIFWIDVTTCLDVLCVVMSYMQFGCYTAGQVHDIRLVGLVGHGCVTCDMVAWKWINMLSCIGNAMLFLSLFKCIWICLDLIAWAWTCLLLLIGLLCIMQVMTLLSYGMDQLGMKFWSFGWAMWN